MLKAHIISPGDVVMIQTPNYGREDTVKYYILDEYKEELTEVSAYVAGEYQKAESHEDYWDEQP